MDNYFSLSMDKREINQISALGLAHCGDAVFELLVRTKLCVEGGTTNGRLHQATIALVQAPAQARFALRIQPLLTPEEAAVYRRGRNAHPHGIPKHATPGEYARATGLEALFARYGIPYHIRRTEIGPVVFEYRQEKNPCSLCAKLRRGALHTAAQELGCNKVALGHHLDDAVETFYMNLWREGRIGCFSPVTYLSQRDLTLIRPMLLATEYEVQCAVREEGLPIVKSRCPADGVTVREQTKEFVRERCRTDHAFRQKTLHALQESGIDGWRPVHTGRGSFIQTAKKDES